MFSVSCVLSTAGTIESCRMTVQIYAPTSMQGRIDNMNAAKALFAQQGLPGYARAWERSGLIAGRSSAMTARSPRDRREIAATPHCI